MINEQRLRAKGWSDYEIHEALDVLMRAEEQKHPMIKILDIFIYWIFLFVALVGNAAFSFALLPIVVAMSGPMLYVMVGFVGFIFGIMCTTLLRSIDRMDTKHHVIYGIITPFIGIINFLVMYTQSNKIVQQYGIGYTHSSLWLGVIYLIFFFVPYAVFRGGKDEWI